MSSKKPMSHKEAKEPDAFITTSEQIGRFLLKNKNTAMIIMALIVVLGGSSSLWNFLQKNKAKKASQAFYLVDRQYNDIQVEKSKLSESIDKLSVAPKKEKAADKSKRLNELTANKTKLTDLKNKVSTLIPLYSKMAMEHKGTGASYLALMAVSHIYFELDNVDKAISTLNDKSLFDGGDSFFHGLAQIKLGTLYIHKREYQKSIDQLDKVISNAQLKFLHSEALVKKGVCQQNLGQTDAAEKTFTKVSEEFSDNEAGKTAKKYLNLIKFKQGQSS